MLDDTENASTSQGGWVTSTLPSLAKNLSIVESDMWTTKMIFDNRSESVYSLNVTAKIIWDTFKGGNLSIETAVQNLRIWCNKGVDERVVKEDTVAFLQKLQQLGLLITLDKGGSFPVGMRVNITQNDKDVEYIAPEIRVMTKEFLEKNHPAAFHRVLFSDLWGPGGKPS